MRGDFSRIRRDTGKGYTSVLQQQGRVALDADANEQCFLDEALRRTQAVDVIGKFGAPAGEAGFAISVSGGQILIGPGRYYVDGLLCENPSQLSYDEQPFLSVPPAQDAASLLAMTQNGQALQLYLQAWQRLVTALDDPSLREPALGQADTTARVQTVWRVIARPGERTPPDYSGHFCPAMYASRPAASSGTLTVTASGPKGGSCAPVAAAGFQGAENQLYRVEIHRGGDASVATFKWSRENGSLVSAVTDCQGTTVYVDSVGPDANLGFDSAPWVELTDDAHQFSIPPNAPGILSKVTRVDKDTQAVTLATPIAGIDPGRKARIRRWDQSGLFAGPDGVPLSAGTPVELENGIQVTFGQGTYKTGDYWTFPARAATGTVEWPPRDADGSRAQPPTSIEVHEAPLGCIYLTIVGWRDELGGPLGPGGAVRPLRAPIGRHPVWGPIAVDDCRLTFGPLTDPSVPAIHVKEIGWFNDDIMPFDQLVNSGLTVTLDHAVTSPVDGGNFIVTLEPTVSQPAASATAFFRAIQVLDSQVVSNDRVLSWLPTLDPSTQVAIQGTLSAGVPPASFARTRVRVRLVGQMFFANGPEGLLHLDGKALGQSGTRADVSTPRTDLRFPSGDGSKASDLESWFYLAPAQQVSAAIHPADPNPADPNSNSKVLHLWAIDSNRFQHVAVPSDPNKSPVTISVTVSLLYSALADVTVGLELSRDGSDWWAPDDAPMVSVPSSVVIPRGQQDATVAVTISSFPTPPAPPAPLPPDVHFTVTASLTLAVSSLSSKADVNFYIGYPPDFRLANPPGAVGGGVLPGGPVMRG